MVEFETRTLRRSLAALPDAACALLLLYAWLAPLSVGREGVLISGVLVALELPALLALACLFTAYTSKRWLDKVFGLAFLVFMLAMVWRVVAEMHLHMSSLALTGSVASMLFGKWLIFRATRCDSLWRVEGMKLLLHFLLFMLILNVAHEASIPRGGFTDAALQQLALPSQPFGGASPNSPWTHPWWLLAGGGAYFSVCAVTRYYLSIKSDETAENGLDSKTSW